MGFKRDLMCSVATFALFAYPAQAEDIFSGGELPAVSDFNAKLEGYGGFVEDDVDDGARAGAIGSFTMPLGHSLGFQIDGAIGDYAGETTGGVQGHLFLRDPASHLLGISAMYHAIGSNDIFRIGPEGDSEQVLSGPGVVGLAFLPSGEMVVATGSNLYRVATEGWIDD